MQEHWYNEIGQVEPTPEPAPDNPEQPDDDGEHSGDNEDPA
jgi:hypothetical protein